MRTPTELSLARQVLRKWQAALGKKRTVTSPLNNGGQPSHGRKRWHKRALKIKQWLVLLKALSLQLYTTELKWSEGNWGSLCSRATGIVFGCTLQPKLPIPGVLWEQIKVEAKLYPQCHGSWSPYKTLYKMEIRSQFKWEKRNWEQDLLTQLINTPKLSVLWVYVSCAIVLWQSLGYG